MGSVKHTLAFFSMTRDGAVIRQAQMPPVAMWTSPSDRSMPTTRPSMTADPQTIHELLRLPPGPMISLPRVSTWREVAERISMSPNSMA